MKNWWKIIPLILILMLNTGCWSRREVDILAIASTIGIDEVKYKEEGKKIKFSVLVVKPELMGGGPASRQGGSSTEEVPGWLGFAQGDTLFEAERNFSTTSSKRLFLGHVSVVIIGEETAKKGVKNIIDLLQRHKDIRLRTWVLISEGEAREAMLLHPELERLPAEEINGMLTHTVHQVSKTLPVDLKDFLVDLATPGKNATLPIIEQRKVSTKLQHPGAEGSGQEDEHENARLKGIAVFKKDKMVGKLNDEEAKGFLWVIGKAQSGILAVSHPERTFPHISIVMVRSSSQIKIKIVEGKPEITVKIKAEGDLGEHGETHTLTNPEDIKHLEHAYAAVIKNQAEKAIRKCQKELESDVFGFGAKLHKQQLKYWKEANLEKEWDKIFPGVGVDVQVEAKIRRTGMTSENIEIK